MKISGEQLIPAERPQVWAALNDPAVLQRCLPGCQSVEQQAPDRFAVQLTSTIGPMRVRFRGLLRLEDVMAPESCVMRFEGQGGAMGFAQGAARVVLTGEGAETLLRYEAEAQMGGKLAQLGGRVIEGVVQKLSGDFFDALREVFQATVADDEADAGSTMTSAATVDAAASLGAPPVPPPSVRTRPAPGNRQPPWWREPIPGWLAVLAGVVVGFVLGRL